MIRDSQYSTRRCLNETLELFQVSLGIISLITIKAYHIQYKNPTFNTRVLASIGFVNSPPSPEITPMRMRQMQKGLPKGNPTYTPTYANNYYVTYTHTCLHTYTPSKKPTQTPTKAWFTPIGIVS